MYIVIHTIIHSISLCRVCVLIEEYKTGYDSLWILEKLERIMGHALDRKF